MGDDVDIGTKEYVKKRIPAGMAREE